MLIVLITLCGLMGLSFLGVAIVDLVKQGAAPQELISLLTVALGASIVTYQVWMQRFPASRALNGEPAHE
jgi:hypothetical protein